MKSSNLQIFKFVLIFFLFWKAIITFLAFFGLSNFPIRLDGDQVIWANGNIDFWLRWANWDGGHFLSIAENGYLFTYQIVFFPLYPLLIKSLMNLALPSIWGGLIISNASTIAALFFFYKLISLDYDDQVAKRGVFLILGFPTAFYFNAVYSEGLFLFLTISAFYFSRKSKWFLAFFLASLASVTRLTGLIVILAIALEFFLKTVNFPKLKTINKNFFGRYGVYFLIITIILSSFQRLLSEYSIFPLFWIVKAFILAIAILGFGSLVVYLLQFTLGNFRFRNLFSLNTLYLVLSLVPFGLYSFYLFKTQSNFLAFIPQQQHWDRYLTLPWSAPINYLRDIFMQGLFKVGKTDQLLVEFVFFIFFLICLIFSYAKLRLSYTVFFALSLIIPITTGTLQSIHRYGLVIFPVFILLALIKNEARFYLWLYFSLSLLGIFTVLFINGYWVS